MKSQKFNTVEEYLPSKPKAQVTSRASKSRKSASKAKPGASEVKPVKLLSGDNPQIAKADGDAPVQAYLAAIPGWKRANGELL